MNTRLLLLIVAIQVATVGHSLAQPVITLQPQPANFPLVSLGMSVTNRIGVGGTGPFAYQWRQDGVPIPGQTSSTIVLTNLGVAQAGTYDVVVTNAGGSITSQVVILTIDTTFTKITRGPIVEDREPSNVPTWGDFDNDGLLDLFVPNNSDGTYPNALYRNLDGDEFVRMTNALTTAVGPSWGAQWGDVDNDGDLDMFINRQFSATGYPDNVIRNELFRNDGGGSFTRMVNAVTTTLGFWTDATWVDHDRDGLLDLFLTTQYFGGSTPVSDCFFRNIGDGQFTAWTTNQVGPVLHRNTDSAGPIWCDIDGDGDLDLYVSKYGVAWNYLYRNDDGVLKPVTAGSLPAARPTWGATWGDFNNDGLFDLFTGGENGTNMLHLNRGGWVFEDVTVASGLAGAGNLYQVTAGDFDNDGDLDLYVPFFDKPDVFYVNRGDATFDRANLGVLLTESYNNGAVWVDYNNDGFLDLFLGCGDAVATRNLLYRNSLPQHGNTNHWLKVQLKGIASNGSAIGAKVSALATIAGESYWQTRQVITGCLTPNPADGMRSHFGLGDATNVTTLRIEWPSGIVQELQNVAANQILTVVESQGYTGASPQFSGVAKVIGTGVRISFTEPAAGARYIVEACTNLVTWTKLMARTSVGAGTNYIDSNSPKHARRFYRLAVP